MANGPTDTQERNKDITGGRGERWSNVQVQEVNKYEIEPRGLEVDRSDDPDLVKRFDNNQNC